MKEQIRIQFTRDGATLPVTHLEPSKDSLDKNAGLVFAFETTAKPLGFGIGLTPGNPVVENAMATVRRNEDWDAGKFLLKVDLEEDGSLLISGGGKRNPAASLPPGQYELRFRVSETNIKNELSTIDIPSGGKAEVRLNMAPPPFRFVLTPSAEWDDEPREVCQHPKSRIDSMDPLSWLNQPSPRMARKVCLINLLAKARALPSARRGESLCPLIESIHWADVDRIDVRAKPALLPKLQTMTNWKDHGPIHPAHAQTIASIFGGSPNDYTLESFREPESQRSLQVVVAKHKTTGEVFAEFDIDLGNPGVDLAGLFIHVGELLDPGRTSHLDLFDDLRGGPASDFLYYRLEHGSAAGQSQI